FFSIVRELRDRINAARAARGRAPIPMPELVNDPMTAPNAYATGRSPFHALVGVTAGIKEMTLNPEELRAGLIRMLAATDPDGKSFRVFRKAIAGSVPGVSAQAAPREVAEAVKAASAADLKKLGVRALRGVLAHELSHVMDRHMLLGCVAAAISSAVAFASYGVMWAVGHARALGARVKARLFTKSRQPSDLGDVFKKGDARVTLEPVATGLAVGSLPALLRVFAALWGPIILQITQMAASRSNEGMADEDGGRLGEDPEALALALGLLTSWRPKTAMPVAAERLPIVAANAHIYTVNPLQQLQQAGALPKLDRVMEAVVGKADDFFMNLFITHPDTTQRIERLYELSEVRDASR
ncbi:MAG: M48 family metalloprotease, partial [Elusimicrobia bacterium]|nr:M48 family metalloprotease [Elusimicrobiota bacterium]